MLKETFKHSGFTLIQSIKGPSLVKTSINTERDLLHKGTVVQNFKFSRLYPK